MLLSMLSIDQLLRPTWERVVQMYPELPTDVEILIGNFVGECGPARDTGGRRVYMGNDRIIAGSIAVLQQMLHCGAHILAATRGVSDTSQGFRYHNSDFLALGQELGLEYFGDRSQVDGYARMALAETGIQRYEWILNRLAIMLPEVRTQIVLPQGRASSQQVGAACQCDPPLSIRAGQSTLDLGVVTCTRCGASFTAKEEDS